MKRQKVMTLLVLALFPLAVRAAGPEASHRQAAEELLQTMDLERVMVSGANTMLDAQAKGNPALAAYHDVIQKWLGKYLTWEVMGPRMTDLYVHAFTEPELRALTAFYKTPTGQKALATMPDVMQQGAQIGLEVGQQHMAELQEMIRARKEELEKAKKPPEKEVAAPEPSGADPLSRANQLFDSKKWDEAAAAYTEYLKSTPGNLDAMTDLGACYRGRSDFEGALKQFDSVLALDSHHWKAMYNKVIVLAFDLKRKDQAEELLAKLQGLQPDNADVKNLQEAVDKL